MRGLGSLAWPKGLGVASKPYFVLNLKIHYLQTAGGELLVKSTFLGDFGTFLYFHLHNVSFRSLDLLDQCQIIANMIAEASGFQFTYYCTILVSQ